VTGGKKSRFAEHDAIKRSQVRWKSQGVAGITKTGSSPRGAGRVEWNKKKKKEGKVYGDLPITVRERGKED